MRKSVIFRADFNDPIKVYLQNGRSIRSHLAGAVLFDCAYRKLQVQAGALEKPYIATLGGILAAGCHTYGESWLGHMNYTLTGLVLR